MMLMTSDIAGRYGMNPRKLGQNRIQVTWDGNDSPAAYLDVRTLYREGNNQGVGFHIEGAGCECEVSGHTTPMPSPFRAAELAAREWFLIGTLIAGTNQLTLSDLRLWSVIYLNFTDGPGTVSVVR
jgi:hypothetical protein